MKKLIVTADDFGYTKSINEGIIRAATQGIVTDIAAMVLTDAEDLDHGLKLLKRHNLTQVGLHTSLFPWGKTSRPQRKDFIDFFNNASDQEIAQKALSEIAQFEKYFGMKPKFISPQFNMHGNLRLMKVMADYVVSNKIPMRLPLALIEDEEISDNNYATEIYLKRLKVKMTDHLFAHILGSNSTLIQQLFLADLAQVKNGESVEIILHPGYAYPELLQSSSLNYERSRDLALSLDPTFKDSILKAGFTFTHMSAL